MHFLPAQGGGSASLKAVDSSEENKDQENGEELEESETSDGQSETSDDLGEASDGTDTDIVEEASGEAAASEAAAETETGGEDLTVFSNNSEAAESEELSAGSDQQESTENDEESDDIVEESMEAQELSAVAEQSVSADEDNNISVTVRGSVPSYYKVSSILIAAVNPLATLDNGSNEKTVELEYGWNDIRFSITSADGTKTAYYYLRWNRMKTTRTNAGIASLKASDFWSVPADGDESNGKICGLNPEEYYEYCLYGRSDWQTINGVSEITGLSKGTWRIKYGESPSYTADSDSLAVSVIVGDSSQTMEIRNPGDSRLIIDRPSASAGEKISFKILLDENEWVESVSIDNFYDSSFSSRTALTVYFVEYTSDESGKYYHGYFIMPTAYHANRCAEVKGVTTFTGAYYSVTASVPENAVVTVTPSDTDSTFTVNGTVYYKENSEITIAVTANQTYGTSTLKSFSVCQADGTEAAKSTDGTAVTLTVTSDLVIKDVEIEFEMASLTEMNEQLARVENLDLSRYTDDSRVILEERLELAKQMEKVTVKDQNLVDEFTATLKTAIDNLVPKAGDFDETNQLLAEIPSDLTFYTDESVAVLQAAKENCETAIKEGWNRLRQEEIDELADALAAAVKGLTYKSADYTAVDAAIEKIPSDLSVYTDESVAVLNQAKAAVLRDKNITEQDAVDEMAKALEQAIAGLVRKSGEEETETEEPETEGTETEETETESETQETTETEKPTEQTASDTPETGDDTPIMIWVTLLMLSGIAGLTVFARRRRA